jgi:hypothetical protein
MCNRCQVSLQLRISGFGYACPVCHSAYYFTSAYGFLPYTQPSYKVVGSMPNTINSTKASVYSWRNNWHRSKV